jgi:hypothetical protein
MHCRLRSRQNEEVASCSSESDLYSNSPVGVYSRTLITHTDISMIFRCSSRQMLGDYLNPLKPSGYYM